MVDIDGHADTDGIGANADDEGEHDDDNNGQAVCRFVI